MPFTVVWIPSAQHRLAHIWVNAADRQAVTAACDRIDRTLRLNALRVGRPKVGGRLYTDAPLTVLYQVLPNDCLVRVLGVSTA